MTEKRGFASVDVSAAVGMQPTLLNKFIDRDRNYGIKPSVQRGKRGGERIFSEQDVYGIALVHWLFESGLRSETIEFVLNQICGRREPSANDAAALLVAQKPDVLVVTREPRIGYAKHPEQKTHPYSIDKAVSLVEDAGTRSVLVIPVANLFAKLRARLEKANAN
jgi:hypothetical protein